MGRRKQKNSGDDGVVYLKEMTVCPASLTWSPETKCCSGSHCYIDPCPRRREDEHSTLHFWGDGYSPGANQDYGAMPGKSSSESPPRTYQDS